MRDANQIPIWLGGGDTQSNIAPSPLRNKSLAVLGNSYASHGRRRIRRAGHDGCAGRDVQLCRGIPGHLADHIQALIDLGKLLYR